MTYRFLPHTADLKVAIDAETFDELLTDGVCVMRQLLIGQSPVTSRERRRLVIEGEEPGELVLGFLREILYQFATVGFVPANVMVEQSGPPRLVARVGGERLDPTVHEHQPEVKAVTRHGFTVTSSGPRWHAEIVFDV